MFVLFKKYYDAGYAEGYKKGYDLGNTNGYNVGFKEGQEKTEPIKKDTRFKKGYTPWNKGKKKGVKQ